MLKYLILGIIQGLTEFLPVSSSAHLVIMQRLLGLAGQELVISIVLHLGTGLALLIFFFKDILKVFRDIKLLSLVIIVTIITGIIGRGGKDFFENLFSSTTQVAMALIITGIILLLTKRFKGDRRDILGIRDAISLGITQGIAIIPGISRSGITISTLLFRGVNPDTSFKFSLLASIPAVLGAVILEAKEISFTFQYDFKNITFGFIASLLSGILSLRILKIILHKARLYYFGYYCIVVAIIILLFIK